MMERASLLCSGNEVGTEHLLLEAMTAAAEPARDDWAAGVLPAMPGASAGALAAAAGRPTQPFAAAVADAEEDADAERDRILRVLAQYGGNQSRAAKALGMARSTLVLRLNSYQIPRPRKGT